MWPINDISLFEGQSSLLLKPTNHSLLFFPNKDYGAFYFARKIQIEVCWFACNGKEKYVTKVKTVYCVGSN